MTAAALKPFIVACAAIVVIVLVSLFLGILPASPFAAFLNAAEVNEYLSAINYFIPLDNFVAIGSAWLACVAPWIIAQFSVAGIKILGEYIPFT